MNKRWFTSKMLITNVIATVAFFVQAQYGYVIDPQMQMYGLAAVNFILRLVTNSPVTK